MKNDLEDPEGPIKPPIIWIFAPKIKKEAQKPLVVPKS